MLTDRLIWVAIATVVVPFARLVLVDFLAPKLGHWRHLERHCLAVD